MIDPATAFATAVGAFNLIKKAVAAGKEIEGVVGQISKWYNAVSDFNTASTVKKNKKTGVFSKLLHEGSVEQEALEVTVHRQKLLQMEKELRELITYAYGTEVYAEMIQMRRKIREDREKVIKEHARRRKEFFENIFWYTILAVVLVVGSFLMYGLFLAVYAGRG